MSLRPELGGQSYYDATGGGYDFVKNAEVVGGTILTGYQLRYIKFLDPSARERLTVPIIPFSKIEELGAKMYRGERLG